MTIESRNEIFFQEILQKHKGIIYKVANSYCENDENRKDLMQEIIFQLWRSLENYNDNFKMSTWIYRIALNVSISFYRVEKRRSKVNSSIPEDILFFEKEEIAYEDDDAQQKIELLFKFIRELKEIDRAIILLYLEEKGQQEISEIMGMTVTNVSSRIHRIKNKLKSQFLPK